MQGSNAYMLTVLASLLTCYKSNLFRPRLWAPQPCKNPAKRERDLGMIGREKTWYKLIGIYGQILKTDYTLECICIIYVFLHLIPCEK
jgi:hypothetical protein